MILCEIKCIEGDTSARRKRVENKSEFKERRMDGVLTDGTCARLQVDIEASEKNSAAQPIRYGTVRGFGFVYNLVK